MSFRTGRTRRTWRRVISGYIQPHTTLVSAPRENMPSITASGFSMRKRTCLAFRCGKVYCAEFRKCVIHGIIDVERSAYYTLHITFSVFRREHWTKHDDGVVVVWQSVDDGWLTYTVDDRRHGQRRSSFVFFFRRNNLRKLHVFETPHNTPVTNHHHQLSSSDEEGWHAVCYECRQYIQCQKKARKYIFYGIYICLHFYI